MKNSKIKSVTVKPETARALINQSGNKFQTITFTKKDGSLRKINGRLNVKKYLKGGQNLNPNLKTNQIIFWDRQSLSYKTINLNSVSKIAMQNMRINIVCK